MPALQKRSSPGETRIKTWIAIAASSWARATLSLVILLGLYSCAHTNPHPLGEGFKLRWKRQVKKQGLDPSSVIWPFTLDEEMRKFATAATYSVGSKVAKLKKLQRALFVQSKEAFRYERGLTEDAATAFHSRKGNCLTFTVMFTTLARSLGIPVEIYKTEEVEEIRRIDEYVEVSSHVVAAYREGPRLHVFDFSSSGIGHGTRYKKLSDVQVSAVFHSNLGIAELLSGRPKEAAIQLEKACRLWPRHAPFWVNLGVARKAMGDMEGALRAYTRALELDSQNPIALNNLAVILQKQGRYVEAREALRAAAKGRATPYTLVALAKIELASGRLKEAKRLLARAKRQPGGKMPELYEALAEWARAAGKEAKAARYEEIARKLRLQ